MGQNALRFQTTELNNESKERTQLIDYNQYQKVECSAYTTSTIRDVSTATALANGRLNQVESNRIAMSEL
ncbi:MAG: hypothetical protein LH647_10550 [Leptolyngbyaceae cyanobacterium CAN_BIN12]|nr:hypothetical protein [Leptolyngbyaceae cyanobacterium CAN_BIN12]